MANTNKGHRLETLAYEMKGAAVQVELGLDLMRAYQEGGIAPNDKKTLSAIAVKHGLFATEDEAGAWVEGDGCNAETQAGYAKAKREGITGVPHFVFQDKYVTSGAIGVDAFYDAIEKILSNKV